MVVSAHAAIFDEIDLIQQIYGKRLHLKFDEFEYKRYHSIIFEIDREKSIFSTNKEEEDDDNTNTKLYKLEEMIE